ncbi:hypothetical protein [Nonomuraea dietziae]|uniref:hypothetical protein n=1 Tax=Nonomuraea dietziae TaxID=65515 RepID=UPI0031D95F43
MRDLRVGRGGEPGVHRSALVGLEVTEGDPAQPLDRHHALHRRRHQREQPPQPGVEEQRFFRVDEILVEHDPGIRDES